MTQKSKDFTVADLIKHLSTLPQDLPVGVVDDCGEFHPMDKGNFHIGYIMQVLDIDTPYIEDWYD